MLLYDSLFCEFFLLLHFLDWFDIFCLFWGVFFWLELDLRFPRNTTWFLKSRPGTHVGVFFLWARGNRESAALSPLHWLHELADKADKVYDMIVVSVTVWGSVLCLTLKKPDVASQAGDY